MSTHTNPRFSSFSQSLQAMSHLLSGMWTNRARFASLAGKSFLGDRDMYDALGYKRDLIYKDFFSRYDREGVCTRIVEAFPNAVWSSNIQIRENEEPGDNTKFEKDILSIVEDHDLFAELLRADIEAGIGRYSVIYIGTVDADLSKEMSPIGGPQGVKFLQTYSEDRVKIRSIIGDGKGSTDQIKKDLIDPRFGQPRSYTLTLTESLKREVHHTRIIHIAKGLLRDKIFGIETLRKGWNLFDDLLKMHGGGAEAVWETVNQGHQWDKALDSATDHHAITTELSEEEISDLEEQLSQRKHSSSRDIFTMGTTVTPLSVPMPQFAPNVMIVLRLLAATYEIPQQILFGAESGKLASDKDRDNWQDRQTEYISKHAQKVLRSVVQRFIDFGGVAKPVDNFENIWPALDELTVPEAAAVLVNISKANKDNVASGGGIIYARDEIRQDVLGKEEFKGLENLPLPSAGDSEDDQRRERQ